MKLSQLEYQHLFRSGYFEILSEVSHLADIDTTLTETEDDDLLFDHTNTVVKAIKSMRFDGLQCPIQKLQNQLQDKDLKLEVLEANPIFFKVFKQKLHKEFRCSFPEYSSLLQYVHIYNLSWQVMYLWEFLVNTQTDENTYQWLKMLIDK